MFLFGPPDVTRLKAKRSTHKLIRALAYEKDYKIRRDAALALGELGGTEATVALEQRLDAEENAYVVTSIGEALDALGWTPRRDRRVS